MVLGTRKIPLPITVPTTIATDALSPNSRASSDLEPAVALGVTADTGIFKCILPLGIVSFFKDDAGDIANNKCQRGANGYVPSPCYNGGHQMQSRPEK